MHVAVFSKQRSANPMAIPKTHFVMKYGPRTGTDEERDHVERVKADLAAILEAPNNLTQLTGDDRKWLLMCIAALRNEIFAWCKTS
jgi:hypothetical protein